MVPSAVLASAAIATQALASKRIAEQDTRGPAHQAGDDPALPGLGVDASHRPAVSTASRAQTPKAADICSTVTDAGAGQVCGCCLGQAPDPNPAGPQVGEHGRDSGQVRREEHVGTAAPGQPGDLMPADAIGLGLCQRPGDPQPREPGHRQWCTRPSPSLMAWWQACIDPAAIWACPASITPERARCRRTKHPIPASATVKGTRAVPGSRAPAPRPGHAHLLLARALITAGNHIDDAVTAHRSGAEAGGEDPPDQEGLACRSRRRCRRQPAGHPCGW
jgi:hypothetical protein